jgi:uncharacterized membrane protein YqaE (UPF0057 family)
MPYLLCFIFPPAAVLRTGRIGSFILCILFTLCLWLPGVIYALVLTKEFDAQQARENKRD